MRTAEKAIADALDEAWRHDATGADAHDIISALRTAGYAIVRVPDIAFKGPHDTNGTMLLTAANKAEACYPVGGSNVGHAVGRVLREVAAAAD